MNLNMKILIVEDDTMVAHIHKLYLDELKSFEIINVIDNGLDAFSYIMEHSGNIDLVILDVHMPKLNGLEMLKLLREENNDISVIPITAINDNNTISEFMNLGVVDYLVKPFSQERFNQAVFKCELKYKLFASNNKLSQSEIDQIFNTKAESVLPKGLQENTLNYIVSKISDLKGKFVDIEDISECTVEVE